ncbi:MAG: flagellar FliJ family protein [Roseibium album]|uniref:Flagellar FliJ protein n=1 Tax=Roseibium album TaxID=311410 RepID=A0A0M6Z425_9HYPH|nr:MULTISPECIES: flagellar FliJ family protein [Stappiaceae]MBG6142143.1 flagellar export protein FliJ [Labrenzia sp. EL_142]MBG6159628.1 flagellar export protein FliJ [Labrenzia sp. EL_162]MBG6164383.1 flagellar export protein FliJ [Labrenzia sp. EL_195]MBG6175718.1 flagellar export protein FliJ [Labrenzia sp. EL_132]MBG6197974.1 flagellar export protein FliJ [Labrenzia sp. EL_159]MBG6204584.1 flagellar export protein FliJ [Labrenzia sp. EL_13]MBG6208587.1 flagellar export protein FliJ [Lab
MKTRDSLIRLKRFQVDEKRRQLAQIESMIAEFNRMADELDVQITTEQERVGITDVTHFAYPTFAKAAADRRDNLRNSALELDDQLQRAQDELSEAIEELKKFEQLEERDHQREKTAQEIAEQDELDEVAARVRLR